jgi:tRNA-specific 2-thiouridylase
VTGDKWRKNKIDAPPLYVKGFNRAKNRLVVAEEEKIYRKSLTLKNLNWLDNQANPLLAQIRYRHKAVPCQIKIRGKKIKVVFKQPQRAITPGQSCVFYQKDKVLGGGIIQ